MARESDGAGWPLERVVLLVGGVVMTAVGVLFLLRPETWQPGEGLSLESPAARTEIRAVYGGIELSVGLFLLACARRPRAWASGLLLAALLGACAGGARLVGAVFESGIDARNALWAGLELAGATVAMVARRRALAREAASNPIR